MIVYSIGDGPERECPAMGWDGRRRTCKRRGCPRCGAPWARDWRRNMAVNLAAKHGSVTLVSITAPGAERLPWDEAHCAHRRRHIHYGPAGCRVKQRAAREWTDTLSLRWGWLRKSATLATRRALKNEISGELGPAPSVLARVWEPQKRGVPHLHLVLGYSHGRERQAAQVFVTELKRLAPEYDFGFVDGRLQPITAEDAARYLSSYLTGRNSSKKPTKTTIREDIADPVMPRSLIWVTPALTCVELPDSSEEWRDRLTAMRRRLRIKHGTGVTMRYLRKARHLWASLDGVCDAPAWRSTREAVLVVAVFLQAFRKRPPPEDLSPALELADRIDADVAYHLGDDIEEKRSRWERYQPQLLPFAFQLAEACVPACYPAAA